MAAIAPVAQADSAAADIVSDDPSDFTPHVLDGSVKSIIQIGDRIIAAGDFTQVRESGSGKPTLSRTRVFAFNATTGKVDPAFAPAVDEEVSVVLAAPDGKSVFLGGRFKTVNGVVMRRLARVNVSDGSLFSGFRNASIDAKVTDLRMIGAQLVVSGAFSTVWAQPRELLVGLNPDTAAMTDFINFDFADPLAGDMNGYKIDGSPDGQRLVVIGNFGSVNGQSRPQLAVIDTSGAQATLAPWHTSFYQQDACDERWWSYIRDVDFDPAGVFFVVTTSGAYRGADAPCDMEARWEIGATDADVRPTWTAYTGGDTTYAVEVTPTAVYVGGHMRWFNNPWAWNQLGAGGVSRTGIGALDPKNGLPLSWDPVRDPRGVGVFDLLATSDGLWMGSDTDGVHGETHAKLAHFPLAGGRTLPPGQVGKLPNDVYLVGTPGGGSDRVGRRFLSDETGPGAGATLNDAANGPVDWSHARGAVLIDDHVYAAWDDGSFRAIPFDGETFGDARSIDLYGTPESKGASNWFGTDTATVTGMTFDPVTNRLIYTMAGSDQLWWRPFTPESEVVGARRYPVEINGGFDPQQVAGMFQSGGRLYFGDRTDGSLRSVVFDGGTVSGQATVVDSHVDWRAAGTFLWHGTPTYVPPTPPIADARVVCAGADCAFDAGASTDADGFIRSYAWSFGDETGAEGRQVRHTFDSFGPQRATLTVTDNLGTTATIERAFEVRPLPARDITYVASAVASANSTRTTVKVPTAVQAGDALVLWLSQAADVPPALSSDWRQVAVERDGSLATFLFTKRASAIDAGSAVTVDYSLLVKNDATLLSYRGVDPDDPFLTLDSTAEGGDRQDHSAPDSLLSADSLRVVTYVADKSSATTSWVLPSGIQRRASSAGTGGGRVTAIAADQAVVPAPMGAVPGVTATADSSSSQATMWSVSLRPEVQVGRTDPHAVESVECALLECSFSGMASTDPDGHIASFQWDMGDGTVHSTAQGSHRYQQPGTYQVALTVTDDDGLADRVVQSVTVKGPPVAPTASAQGHCSQLECAFDGSASVDPDGQIVSYAWDFGDGTGAAGRTPTHTYQTAGRYRAALTVTDEDGATASAVLEVEATTLPSPPQASGSAACVDLTCTLDGSASVDLDGEIVSYVWDFGDGSGALGATSEHTYADAGEYAVTLTVTDEDGLSDTVGLHATPTAPVPVTIRSVGASTSAANGTTVTAEIPGDTAPGDTLLAFVTTNAVVAPSSLPSGWVLEGTQTGREMSTFLYRRSVPADGQASAFRWQTPTQVKIDVHLLAYRGVDSGSPLAVAVAASESELTATHRTPSAQIHGRVQQVIQYWADKTSGATTLIPDAALVTRSATLGSGSGRINAVAADLGSARALSGAVGGATAISDIASRKAVMWTVALGAP